MKLKLHVQGGAKRRSKAPGSPRMAKMALVLLAGTLCLLTAVSLAGAAISSQPAGGEDHTTLDKARLAGLLSGKLKDLSKGGPMGVASETLGPLAVHTSIDPALQKTAEKLLLKQGRNLRSAVVVVDAESGRVLALAGSKGRKLSPAVALDAGASAASLFKVITAAATLERTDIQPQTKLAFAGGAHTLYQYQVYKKTRRRMRLVTLEKGFAQSNNPVFARLGVHWLGKDVLNEYAGLLGFGRRLNFEVPVGVSLLPRPADQFGLGELACGYERHTTMSPLHAALMVAVFTNGGRFVEPYLVDWVTGAGGEVLYHGRPQSSPRLVSSDTCLRMRAMFEATVREGTARRAFKRLYRDRVLKHLEVGGKTGTLRGPDRKELFEWFAGYGRDPVSGRTLAIASLVVHGKSRRANPDRLARKVLREAFSHKSRAQAPKQWGDQAQLPAPGRTGWQAARMADAASRVE